MAVPLLSRRELFISRMKAHSPFPFVRKDCSAPSFLSLLSQMTHTFTIIIISHNSNDVSISNNNSSVSELMCHLLLVCVHCVLLFYVLPLLTLSNFSVPFNHLLQSRDAASKIKFFFLINSFFMCVSCLLAEHVFGETTEIPEADCCACGAAKYRLTFYGNWSEKIHPKDYPRRANHWSALIGASHSKNYMLWEYGGYASDGVRQVAEFGSPIKMEQEIRRKGDEIMTVIKTQAQWPASQPLNLRAAPSAEFSVDRIRHLMSFLTMLGPSPDWNVGLSGKDLCTKDCGWVQKHVADLIPWDAGTDSGVTYESPNKPTIPQEKIRPLTRLDHPQSPFYDPDGGAIIPLARIVIERIARKGEQCNVVPDPVDDIVADFGQEAKKEDSTSETCIYSGWSPWSACSSTTCEKGRQMRQRMLKAQTDLGVPCLHTQDFQPCMAPGCAVEESFTCMMSEWISWSACSVSCGMGMRSRERYIKQYPEDSSLCQMQTEETEKCVVNRDCSPSNCVMTEWGEWEPCSTTCGLGMRRRERTIKLPAISGSACQEEMAELEQCMMPKCR
ncbi:unnamed protein product, partial [Tetraodon nigroviridis]